MLFAEEDGRFSCRLDAGTYRGFGWAEVKGKTVLGGDGTYSFTGILQGRSDRIAATLTVSLDPGAKPHALIASDFDARMEGTADAKSFTLLGTGPLGIIVEIVCTR